MVPQRRGMPGVYPAPPLAGGFRLPSLRSDRGAVDDVGWAAAVPELSWAHIADGRHGVPGHTQAVADVVPGDVVRHPARRTASAPWACSGCSGWAATRRPGLGSTSCVGRWSGLAAIASPAPSRSMKPTSVARKRATGAGKPRPRLLLRWRPRWARSNRAPLFHCERLTLGSGESAGEGVIEWAILYRFRSGPHSRPGARSLSPTSPAIREKRTPVSH